MFHQTSELRSISNGLESNDRDSRVLLEVGERICPFQAESEDLVSRKDNPAPIDESKAGGSTVPLPVIILLNMDKSGSSVAVISTQETSSEDEVQEVLDSHGHLDIFLSRNRYQSVSDYEKDLELTQGGAVCLQGIVTNFVFLSHWRHRQALIGVAKQRSTANHARPGN